MQLLLREYLIRTAVFSLFFFVGSGSIYGQTRSNCSEHSAGSIYFSQGTGFSNDISPEVFYLCFGDEFFVYPNGDKNLSGDSNPATEPGIGYGWYTDRPVIGGQILADVKTDPSWFDHPSMMSWELPMTVGSLSGQKRFSNGYVETGLSFNDFYNGGSPSQFWYAPITFDALTGGVPIFELGANSCVDVSLDQVFSVVYLNPITISGFTATGNSGSFTVRGGLPEFEDNTTYRIVIRRQSTKQIVQDIEDLTLGHESEINFALPVGGYYDVSISDGKSCVLTFSFRAPFTEGPSLSLDNYTGEPGEIVCLPIRVSDFDGITVVQHSLSWNPSVLRFVNLNGVGWDDQLIFFNADADKGSLLFTCQDFLGVTLMDGDIFYEVCFEVVGSPGTCSPITFDDRLTVFELANSDFQSISGIYIDGRFCVTAPTDLTAYAWTCGTNSNKGSVYFEIYGGELPYSWQLLDNMGTIIESGDTPLAGEGGWIRGLTPGSYILVVEDGIGGVFQLLVEVPQYEDLSLSFEVEDPDCSTGSGGSIELTITGGSSDSDFFINWSTGDYDKLKLINLSPGLYQVEVIDSLGCRVRDSIELIGAAFDLEEAIITSATCFGIANGAITAGVLNPEPGAVYFFNWSNGFQEQGTTSSAENLLPGIYELTVTDALGCAARATYEVEAARIFSLTFISSLPTCNGLENGEIRATAVSSPPLPPGLAFRFNWSTNAGNLSSEGPISIAGGLGAGLYSITVSDTGGCSQVFTFSLTQPEKLDLGIESRRPQCGSSDGFIRLSPSGGTPLAGGGYTVTWNDGFEGLERTNLGAGIYGVTLTDENGCLEEALFEWEQEGATASVVVEEISCPESTDGSIRVVIDAGGFSIVRLEWSANAGTPINNGNVTEVSNLGPGIYVLTVEDSGGCIVDYPVELLAPIAAFIDQATIESPSCRGANDGSILLEVGGTHQPIQVTWPTLGITGNAVAGLPAGTYRVLLRDNNGCPIVVEDVIIGEAEEIEGVFNEVRPVFCDTNACEGQLEFNVLSGSSPSGEYLFTWSNGYQETGNRTIQGNLCPGVYSITVSHGDCSRVFEYSFFADSDIVLVDTAIVDVSCFDGEDGSIRVQAGGGVAPYDYRWTQFNGPNYQNVRAGTYLLIVTDAQECSSAFALTVRQPDSFFLAIDSSLTRNVSCGGNGDGVIAVEISGGNSGQVVYNWTPNVSNTNVAVGLEIGNYRILAVDSKGCVASLEHEITGPSPIRFTIPSPQEPFCHGDLTRLTVSQASGGIGPNYTFSVNFGFPQPLGFEAQVQGGQEHTVIVFDSGGCSVDTVLFIAQPEAIEVSLPAEIQIRLGEEVQLRPVISSVFPLNNYRWTPGLAINDQNIERPVVSPIEDQVYSLVVTDSNGCEGRGSVFVRVNKVKNIIVPNVFSPNGDGINDELLVFPGPAVAKISRIQVFNRWGQRILERGELENEETGVAIWDGMHQGEKAEVGVYIYAVEIVFTDGEVVVFKGDVTLIR
jgi:gliding motility-associated-like protein